MNFNNNNDPIEFHDTAYGGYYCNKCEIYLHPDIIHSHREQHRNGFIIEPFNTKD